MALVTLQTIFQDAFPAYEQTHPLPTHVRRAARAIMQCRTEAASACALYGDRRWADLGRALEGRPQRLSAPRTRRYGRVSG